MRRLRALFSDAFWLYLFPASAVLMPWPWYFRICRLLTRVNHPYRAGIEQELQFAQGLLPELNPNEFRRDQALMRFVDAADFYLCLCRSRRWFNKYVDKVGQWPAPGAPTLLLGNHWGAAQWIWPDLLRSGHSAWFLARSSVSEDFGQGRLAWWYGRLRGWGIVKAGASGIIITGGARARIAKSLGSGDTVVVLNDVPAMPGKPSATVQLLRRTAALPTGAIELARACSAAVCHYVMAVDAATGHRTLTITHLPSTDIQSLCDAYADHLDRMIEQRPGCWLAWAVAPQLFTPTSTPEAA